MKLEPSGHTFEVAAGETLLEAALRQGIGLPYGCRNGACGACKGVLRSGSLEYGDYQERALHDSEKLAGKALTCCTRPLTDSARTVLAGLFLIFPGVVSDLIALTLLLLPGPRVVTESVARRDPHGTLIEGEFRRTR